MMEQTDVYAQLRNGYEDQSQPKSYKINIS